MKQAAGACKESGRAEADRRRLRKERRLQPQSRGPRPRSVRREIIHCPHWREHSLSVKSAYSGTFAFGAVRQILPPRSTCAGGARPCRQVADSVPLPTAVDGPVPPRGLMSSGGCTRQWWRHVRGSPLLPPRHPLPPLRPPPRRVVGGQRDTGTLAPPAAAVAPAAPALHSSPPPPASERRPPPSCRRCLPLPSLHPPPTPPGTCCCCCWPRLLLLLPCRRDRLHPAAGVWTPLVAWQPSGGRGRGNARVGWGGRPRRGGGSASVARPRRWRGPMRSPATAVARRSRYWRRRWAAVEQVGGAPCRGEGKSVG